MPLEQVTYADVEIGDFVFSESRGWILIKTIEQSHHSMIRLCTKYNEVCMSGVPGKIIYRQQREDELNG